MPEVQSGLTADAEIVSVDLSGKTPEERAALKAQAIYNRLSNLNLPFSFSLGTAPRRITVTVTDVMLQGNCVGFKLTARVGSKQLPVDPEGYFFYNPPIRTADGREDIIEVGKIIVVKAVIAYARQHGMGGDV